MSQLMFSIKSRFCGREFRASFGFNIAHRITISFGIGELVLSKFWKPDTLLPTAIYVFLLPRFAKLGEATFWRHWVWYKDEKKGWIR